jgi:DNA modification methylase
LSQKDRTRAPSASGSNFAKNVSNWKNRAHVYPTNVLHLATECGNQKHAAAFPVSLPEFFIKLFTQPDDTVLDPFAGSGTTGVAAVTLKRNYIGVDIQADNNQQARARLRALVSAQKSQ